MLSLEDSIATSVSNFDFVNDTIPNSTNRCISRKRLNYCIYWYNDVEGTFTQLPQSYFCIPNLIKENQAMTQSSVALQSIKTFSRWPWFFLHVKDLFAFSIFFNLKTYFTKIMYVCTYWNAFIIENPNLMMKFNNYEHFSNMQCVMANLDWKKYLLV